MPAISATPSAIAIAVSTTRSLRAGSRADHASISLAAHAREVPDRLHQVERLLGGRAVAVVDDAAVGEDQQAVGERGGVRVVGDHHDRLAEVVDGVAQQRRAPRPRLWSRGCRTARRRTRPPGREISARATATRCCWPPESSAGRWLSRSRIPTVSISRSNHSRSGLRPAIESGSRMFSSAFSTGSRLKVWKMNPIVRGAAGSAAVVELRSSIAVHAYRARSRPV